MLIELLERTKISGEVTMGKTSVSKVINESKFHSVEHRKVSVSPRMTEKPMFNQAAPSQTTAKREHFQAVLLPRNAQQKQLIELIR